MTQPYLVIETVEGKVGAVYETDNFDEAVIIAREMACEQSDLPPKAIHEELEKDLDWCDETGNIWIQIAQAERRERV